MADRGFPYGFIVAGIDMAISQILHHINIALYCRKELDALKDLVMTIEPIVTQIHQYRLELNRKRGISTHTSDDNASAINVWVEKLDKLLRLALAAVQKCNIPGFDVSFRCQTRRRITSLISNIDKHLKLVPLILLEQRMRRESTHASSSTSATSSHEDLAPTAGGFLIQQPLIVGQEKAFTTLEMWLIDADANSLFRIGVVGEGGSGKTLLMKRLFSSRKVRDFFRDGFLLWLTVTQSPSFATLRDELCRQIAMPTKVDLITNMKEEDAKVWLNQRMQGKRFALFLDDVWGEGGKLLEELGLNRLTDHANSKVIVSSRNRRALIEVGVSETSIITMGDLVEEKSWELFGYHAFPYNNGNPPANIDERMAKLVCAKCGGLPLAIKAVGRAMSGVTGAQELELALRRMPNEKSEDHEALHDRLRWSYDSLGNYHVNLQLCFLYLAAAFVEDQIIDVHMVIPMWIGEGLVAINKLKDQRGLEDQWEIGRLYIDFLADRCLIEPVLRDVQGRVLRFTMHDVLRDLAIRIAQREENFYCRAGKGLKTLTESECSGCTRILLNDNELTSLPERWRAQKICSLLMARNSGLKEISKTVIETMISLKVLDLTWTSVKSLPESVDCLKQLVCLMLIGVPIKKLPASLSNLANLQILNLDESSITELPANIHRWRSLKILSLEKCTDLICLPCSISGLTSLQYLDMSLCISLWTERDRKNRWKKVASIANLSTLTQLKWLRLRNNGALISEGTLGSMIQMETLELTLTMLSSLPDDIINMSKLRRLRLQCSHVVKMESRFFEFQNLINFQLWECNMLEELPDLHQFRSLRQLDIKGCPMLKKIPKSFSEKGAFPSLEIFSLIELNALEELPIVEEGAMPSLQIFTMMKCEVLKVLPKSYFTLKRLKKIRVYGCSMVLENMKTLNTKVELVTISFQKMQEIMERYWQVKDIVGGWFYDDYWSNELWLFLQDLHRPL